MGIIGVRMAVVVSETLRIRNCLPIIHDVLWKIYLHYWTVTLEARKFSHFWSQFYKIMSVDHINVLLETDHWIFGPIYMNTSFKFIRVDLWVGIIRSFNVFKYIESTRLKMFPQVFKCNYLMVWHMRYIIVNNIPTILPLLYHLIQTVYVLLITNKHLNLGTVIFVKINTKLLAFSS